MNGFCPGVDNRLCVTESKSSNSGNLKLKSKLITFFYSKVVVKAAVAN